MFFFLSDFFDLDFETKSSLLNPPKVIEPLDNSELVSNSATSSDCAPVFISFLTDALWSVNHDFRSSLTDFNSSLALLTSVCLEILRILLIADFVLAIHAGV